MNQRNIKEYLKWWWDTRILGFFRIRLKATVTPSIKKKTSAITFNHLPQPLAAHDPEGITVILTAYRRVEYLEEQIDSIRKQTIAPVEIWVWTNYGEEELRDISAFADRVIVSNTNWLFWGRFALGNLARTGYVAFFDDDILPQPRWFENCLSTIHQGKDGILGGSGVFLPTAGGYSSKSKAGWNGKHLKTTIEVDLVGHAWFMRKEHLQYIWREEPYFWDNGEDIHLSCMAAKYGGIKTFVPPHPEKDQSLWSCRPDFGKIVGRKKVATFKTATHRNIRSEIVNAYRQNNWRIVAQKEHGDKKLFSGDLYKLNNKLKKHENFAFVRFGDGEMIVINGKSIDLSKKCNGEHKYSPNNENDEKHREILTDSLLYQDQHYLVGLPCRCCVGDDHCDQLRKQSKQNEDQLTWANLFVNSNYSLFLDATIPLLKDRSVIIICHQSANIDNLPFATEHNFRVGANAWTNDYKEILANIDSYICENEVTNNVFIFCAGVLSNLLIYQLFKKYKNNTYIDAGSVFDVTMGLGKTRKYLAGKKKQLRKECVW